jgi:Domain of Unknown Function (DUF1080)
MASALPLQYILPYIFGAALRPTKKDNTMFAQRISIICILAAWLGASALTALGQSADEKKKTEKKKDVWTDAGDPTLPVDFKFQGEFAGKDIGCQVIALGNGAFQAVVTWGGLPGAGWDGKNKTLLEGKLQDGNVVFTPATGQRKYLAQSPLEFSATDKFPPAGKALGAGRTTPEGLIIDDADMKSSIPFEKRMRKSETLGLKAPEGAIVLFDGSNKDEWNGGRLDPKTGFLNTDGNDITTKRKFSNYSAHVEFMLPYRPDGRGQGRGNSGFYQVDEYEVQILDSFGLDGKDNECGGVYTRLAPKVNMCLPPLQWQTYDVDFTNAIADASGKKIKNARITLKHNGVNILDNAEIVGKTGGARNEPEGTPGLLRLQGHGNPLQFRNIWVVEKK